MSDSELFELQKAQKRHDQEYHPDIYYLPYENRARHLVLHFAKYVGRLAAKADPAKDEASLKTTLSDTMIVVLSFSEILKLDLQERLVALFGSPQSKAFAEWGARVDPGGDYLGKDHLKQWWLLRMAPSTGKMAKALESLDHIEPIDVKRLLTEGVVEVLASCVVVAHQLDLDLAQHVRDRWVVIENNRIL